MRRLPISHVNRVARWFIFQHQISQFGYISEALEMENVGTFYDRLEYFTTIWYILWTFGIVCGQLVYFSRFGMFVARQIWQPCS
jgi:hypothetical protein